MRFFINFKCSLNLINLKTSKTKWSIKTHQKRNWLQTQTLLKHPANWKAQGFKNFQEKLQNCIWFAEINSKVERYAIKREEYEVIEDT